MNCDLVEVSERLQNEVCSYSNLSVTSPTAQLILQLFRRFTYITAHSPTLPLLHLRHSSFSNPSFASPTSQDLHLIHLASRPWQSRRCYCHEPLAPLEMGHSGISTVLTQYESMRLRSLRQSERTTARDRYSTRDELIRAIGESIRNINTGGRAYGVRRLLNIWQKVINKGATILKVHKSTLCK